MLRYVAGYFYVLLLIFPYRNKICFIKKNVCRHKDRIVKQSEIYLILHDIFGQLIFICMSTLYQT